MASLNLVEAVSSKQVSAPDDFPTLPDLNIPSIPNDVSTSIVLPKPKQGLIQSILQKATSVFSAYSDAQSLKGYTLRETDKVRTFLGKHTFLIALLNEASYKIRDYFPESELFLRIFTSQESVNDSSLVILIGTSYTPKETLERLDQLESDWWIDAVDRTHGKLSINVEFQ